MNKKQILTKQRCIHYQSIKTVTSPHKQAVETTTSACAMHKEAYLVSTLQMKITGLGMEAQVDAVTVVTDNVLSTRVLGMATSHQFVHTAD